MAAMEKVSPYSYLSSHKSRCVWLDATYPPLFYQLITPYYTLLRSLGIFGPLTSAACPVWPFITSFRVLTAIKIPYLFAHIVTAHYFSKLFAKYRPRWFLFWLLQPIPIFISTFMGQFDALALAFQVAAVFFLWRNQLYRGALLLGVATALKHIPLLFALPAVLFWSRNWRQRLAAILLLILPYGLSLMFADVSEVRQYVFGFSENTKMLAASIPLTGQFHLSWFGLLYLVGIWHLLHQRDQVERDETSIFRIGLLTMLPLLITSSWFLQRAIYVIPFVILFLVRTSNNLRFLHLMNALFFIWAIFGYPAVLDSVLLRAIVPRADYAIPLAHRLAAWFPVLAPDLPSLALTAINSVFAYLFFLALRGRSLSGNEKLTAPSRTDFGLLIAPLAIFVLVIASNLLQ